MVVRVCMCVYACVGMCSKSGDSSFLLLAWYNMRSNVRTLYFILLNHVNFFCLI